MPLLVLQRGHVARTRGATGGPGEQAMARRVADAVAALMPHAGWTLRIIDADEPAWRYRGDAFVSLHGDANASPQAGGASVGWRTPEGRALGQRWKQAYTRHGWPFGWRADNYTAALAGYYGHRHAVNEGNRPAVIVEHGFMTNPRERAWIDSPDGTRAAALAVVEAVTGSTPDTTPPESEEDWFTMATEDDLRKVVREEIERYGRDPLLRERINEVVRLGEASAVAGVASMRQGAGLDPDPESDQRHIPLLRAGKRSGRDYRIADVLARLRGKDDG